MGQSKSTSRHTHTGLPLPTWILGFSFFTFNGSSSTPCLYTLWPHENLEKGKRDERKRKNKKTVDPSLSTTLFFSHPGNKKKPETRTRQRGQTTLFSKIPSLVCLSDHVLYQTKPFSFSLSFLGTISYKNKGQQTGFQRLKAN